MKATHFCWTFLVFSLLMITCQAQTSLKDFKPDSSGGKQDRLDALENYMGQVSKSIQKMERQNHKRGNKEIRKLKKRIRALESQKNPNTSCCQLVTKSNLPKISDDILFVKRKIKELNKKTDELKAKELISLQGDIDLLKSSLESLKKIVLEKLKNQ